MVARSGNGLRVVRAGGQGLLAIVERCTQRQRSGMGGEVRVVGTFAVRAKDGDGGAARLRGWPEVAIFAAEMQARAAQHDVGIA